MRQWLGGIERAWTLLSFDSLLALRQEPSAGRGRNGLRHGCLIDRGRRLGDMASRIEGFTKAYACELVISEAMPLASISAPPPRHEIKIRYR